MLIYDSITTCDDGQPRPVSSASPPALPTLDPTKMKLLWPHSKPAMSAVMGLLSQSASWIWE